jgi:cell division septation protein DedD
MDYKCLHDGQPNEEGFYEAVIENAEGRRISSVKAKSEREMIDQLLNSQVHADREIARLRKPDAARQPLKVEPKELTPADRLRIANEINDPNRVVEAIEEVVTARQGISPDKLGAEFARRSSEEQDEFYGREANAFVREHPAYYPVQQNSDTLFRELKARGWDLTRNNLAIVYQICSERGDLIAWPEQQEVEAPESVAPRNGTSTNGVSAPNPHSPTRPRTIATTGLRSSDASALPPSPPKKQQYTRADIERMSRAEFNEKLVTDPNFRRQVDAMGA